MLLVVLTDAQSLSNPHKLLTMPVVPSPLDPNNLNSKLVFKARLDPPNLKHKLVVCCQVSKNLSVPWNLKRLLVTMTDAQISRANQIYIKLVAILGTQSSPDPPTMKLVAM